MDRLTYRNKNGDVGLIGEKESLTSIEVVDLINNALDKLAHYEELEDDGKLIEMPCAVGDKVWDIAGKEIREQIVDGIEYRPFYNINTFFIYANEDEWLGRLGDLVFLTKEEAEAKLAEVQNG